MATRLTPNLKLRVADTLTSDAVYNLERLDLLGNSIPLTTGASTAIESEGDVEITPGPGSKILLNGPSLVDGTLSLSSGSYTLKLQTATQASNLTLTLPSTVGSAGQFLTTDGTGVLSWTTPNSYNLSGLSDVEFTSPVANQILQFNGTKWVNASISLTKQSGTFTWSVADGASKTISHNYNSTDIIVYIYDPVSKSPVFIDTIDYVTLNTLQLTADEIPPNNYTVYLSQV
jgi:hypothetical protein